MAVPFVWTGGPAESKTNFPKQTFWHLLRLQDSTFLITCLCSLPQFYRCFQALLHCEAPRRGSSLRSSSKIPTKALRGGAVIGSRRTNDFQFMVASLGHPAVTLPQLCTPCDPTIDVTKAPSSDTNKPVVVSLVTHFDGWSVVLAMKAYIMREVLWVGTYTPLGELNLTRRMHQLCLNSDTMAHWWRDILDMCWQHEQKSLQTRSASLFRWRFQAFQADVL